MDLWSGSHLRKSPHCIYFQSDVSKPIVIAPFQNLTKGYGLGTTILFFLGGPHSCRRMSSFCVPRFVLGWILPVPTDSSMGSLLPKFSSERQTNSFDNQPPFLSSHPPSTDPLLTTPTCLQDHSARLPPWQVSCAYPAKAPLPDWIAPPCPEPPQRVTR